MSTYNNKYIGNHSRFVAALLVAVALLAAPLMAVAETDGGVYRDSVAMAADFGWPTDQAGDARPLKWALSTNLLYDAAAVPNIGVEVYLGKQWSVKGEWAYGWWDNRKRDRYWRIYGGGLSVLRRFGPAAYDKPMTGHHVGLYAQILTYDFEFGGRGYMGGNPGGNIFDNPSYIFGVEYGYSLPLSRRLNMSFTVGAGYFGGRYHEYKPVDGHYVWQVTKQRNWFGPTKLDVSLVWLLGRDNINKPKGGAL